VELAHDVLHYEIKVLFMKSSFCRAAAKFLDAGNSFHKAKNRMQVVDGIG